ncbi:MAG: exodeoxyribonuclease III, partial [Alphaproteobacteria bacterium]
SVRLRAPLVERFIADHRPDVLCLQEIKCVNETFPFERLRASGLTHIHVNGQAGYHGVAILSRVPVEAHAAEAIGGNPDARYVSVRLAVGVTVHNVYIPAGGDVPDASVNPKFGQKLDYISALADWFVNGKTDRERLILTGDFNVAPLENDVWSHKQLLKVVSHTPIEVEHLTRLQASLDWTDAVRKHVPDSEKLFTWWSYRNRDWRKSNRGRRLDHIWTTPDLTDAAKAMTVLKDARDWEKPSDHVPVIADFDLGR